MNELQKAIAHCEERGGLNLSDLARWLDTGVHTVIEWARKGREPRAYKRKFIYERMNRLVELVDAKPPGVPLIPCDLKQDLRRPFIEKLKDEHLGILQEDTTR